MDKTKKQVEIIKRQAIASAKGKKDQPEDRLDMLERQLFQDDDP